MKVDGMELELEQDPTLAFPVPGPTDIISPHTHCMVSVNGSCAVLGEKGPQPSQDVAFIATLASGEMSDVTVLTAEDGETRLGRVWALCLFADMIRCVKQNNPIRTLLLFYTGMGN
ncbi:UNVERIFIED_CONTAM: hypothetical protein K2H54_018241 [Gekko kuhli]